MSPHGGGIDWLSCLFSVYICEYCIAGLCCLSIWAFTLCVVSDWSNGLLIFSSLPNSPVSLVLWKLYCVPKSDGITSPSLPHQRGTLTRGGLVECRDLTLCYLFLMFYLAVHDRPESLGEFCWRTMFTTNACSIVIVQSVSSPRWNVLRDNHTADFICQQKCISATE